MKVKVICMPRNTDMNDRKGYMYAQEHRYEWK
jgi:hypothetical protein